MTHATHGLGYFQVRELRRRNPIKYFILRLFGRKGAK